LTASSIAEATREGASACVIATDTGRHARDARAALALGLDVLVEKPAACNAQGARAIAAAASSAGRKAYVGCVLCFCDSIERFRRELPHLGELHSVDIECRSYLPDWRARPYRSTYSARWAEGGVLRDLIHEIDYAGWLFGFPKEVSGRLENLGRLGIASEEAAELSWRTPRGGLVSVGLDYLTRPPLRRMTARGRRGTLVWDGIARTVSLSLARAGRSLWHSRQTRDMMFEAQAKAFLSALDGRPNERLATIAQGISALAVCDAARRSSRSGRIEKVAPL
jgi:predicted dehydrogenase